MPFSEEYLAYVMEQLEGVGNVFSKKMFGGAGLYLDGIFFALIADDILYFKVDDSNRIDFENAGMEPFKPYGPASYAMQYYEVPVEILEDKERLYLWAQRAFLVAKQKGSCAKSKEKKNNMPN